MKSLFLGLVALASFSTSASPSGSKCENIYDVKGSLIEEALVNYCEQSKIRWFFKDDRGLYHQLYLNDPAEDDKILIFSPPKSITIMSQRKIQEMTKHVQENTIFDAFSLLELMNKSWNELDFAHVLWNNSMEGPFMINGIVYGNRYDFGNFLWGYAAAKLGTSLKIALAGAHYNNLFNKSKYEKYQLGAWAGGFDSWGDQRAITAGHTYFFKTATKQQIFLKVIDILVL